MADGKTDRQTDRQTEKQTGDGGRKEMQRDEEV